MIMGMGMTTDLRTTLADLIAEFVEPYTVTETIPLRSAVPDDRAPQHVRVHRATFPSLLDQLMAAIEPSSGVGVARGYESSPAASIEALDLGADIMKFTLAFLAAAGVKSRGDLAPNIRAFVSIDMSDRVLRLLVAKVMRWVVSARIITRWDSAAIRPRASCGACDARGSLRVSVDPVSAVCVACGETWNDESEVAILGEYIRWCNGETSDETEEVAA
jgi:hypothetical protein